MIYLDANATTPMLPEVLEAMRPWMTEPHGNPSSAHALGRKSRQAMEDARDLVAAILGAKSEEVLFTSGATEANNLAMFGHASAGTVLVSPVDHPCVIEPGRKLAERGAEVVWLAVDPAGIVADLADKLDDRTRLVAIQLANHETGTIQPIEQFTLWMREQAPQACFHCDAAQAVGKVPVHFRELDVDSLSLSGHKFHGPAGVGALLLKNGVRFQPLMRGGTQQHGKRPGTEAVSLAVGLSKALEIADAERDASRHRMQAIQGRLWASLVGSASPAVRNGGGSPYVLNVSFPGCRGELLLMKLDLAGVACSTGSACSSGSQLPSPVLQAMGVPDEVLRSAMRFSWTRFTTEEEIDEAAKRIAKCVRECRADQSSTANAAT